MYIYILLTVFIIIFGNIFEKKHKKIYAFMVFIIFTLIAGLRHYTIGCDTETYINIFNRIAYSGIYYSSWLEPGWVYLNYFVSLISINSTFFLIIIAMVINGGICYFIYKYSDNMCESFLLIIFSRIFFNEMNIIRQYFSNAIILFGIKYIQDKKFIKYGLCVAIATLIHTSSCILIVLYFIRKTKFHLQMR